MNASKPPLDSLPLCQFFLSGYLSHAEPNSPYRRPDVLDRCEKVFNDGVQALVLTKDELRARTDFNFDKATTANLDAAIGVLRTAVALRSRGFNEIQLLANVQNRTADLTCRQKNCAICVEVKTLTTESYRDLRPGQFLQDQLLRKLRDVLPTARGQLISSRHKTGCHYTMFVAVMNWTAHSVILVKEDFQFVANELDMTGDLKDVDIFMIVTQMGEDHLFVSDEARQSGLPL